MRPIRTLLLFACAPDATFSYHVGWPRHFQRHPAFECTPINLADRRWTSRLRANTLARLWRGDLVVMLHSVFSNAQMLTGALFDAVRALPQPKAYFIGNEYKFMSRKMTFCEELGVSLLVSQSMSSPVHSLYRDRLRCAVTGIPNTGLDPAVFAPVTPRRERPIDLGYRADDVPAYLGHNERRELATFFQSHARDFGLAVDISLDPGDRFQEREWAAFLNRCKGQLGSEAGGDYFLLDDQLREQVNAYVRDHPEAPLSEVHSRFFATPPSDVPMRILSGRQVEAAATQTVQVLFAGHYDGFFVADEHYIPLDKDFGNVADVLRKLRDEPFVERVVHNAYRLVTSEFTYPQLIDRFRVAAAPLAGARPGH